MPTPSGLVAAVALAPAVLLAVIVCVIGGGAQASPNSAACNAGGTAQTVTGIDLDAEQLTNAHTIITVTAGRDLPTYAAIVAVDTAYTESTLHNYTTETDHDSRRPVPATRLDLHRRRRRRPRQSHRRLPRPPRWDRGLAGHPGRHRRPRRPDLRPPRAVSTQCRAGHGARRSVLAHRFAAASPSSRYDNTTWTGTGVAGEPGRADGHPD